MKKTVFLMVVQAFVLTIGVGTAQAQQLGIDDAIRRVATELSTSIESGAAVAVLSMQADSARMSDYLIRETINALIELQVGRGFTTVDRARFDQLLGGLHVNMAGPVGDVTIRTAGNLLDVRYVITGTFGPLAGFFRFRAQVIEVQTAAIRKITHADILNDSLVAYLMGGTLAAPPPAASAQPIGRTANLVVSQNAGWIASVDAANATVRNNSNARFNIGREVIDRQERDVLTMNVNLASGNGWRQGLFSSDNDEIVQLLRSSEGIRFRVLGDGQTWVIRFPTNSVMDYGYHEVSFRTRANTVTEISIPFSRLRQPSWARRVRFSRNEITEIHIMRFSTTGSAISTIRVFDFDFI